MDADLVSGDYLHPVYSGSKKSQIDLAYVKAAVSGQIEATKAPERAKVLQFILDNQKPGHSPRLLTNPGPLWTFERQVEWELGEYKAYFVGIERSWSILEYGLRWMPGQQKRSLRLELEKESVLGFISAKAAILHDHVEYVTRHLRFHKRQQLRSFTANKSYARLHRSDSKRHFNNFTGCWIDIWSPLGRPEIALFLRNVTGFSAPHRIPFAFTFQYGRDQIRFAEPRSGDELDARAEAIKSELETRGGEFLIHDAWWYFGPNDSRLATVCGIFDRTKETTERLRKGKTAVGA